jgi:hypothetical protein
MTISSRFFFDSWSLKRAAASIAISSLALVAAACSYRNPEFPALTNQGIIPVSRTNPYVGSNLYLAHEMEESTYLYNFFKEKGVPQAIEIAGGSEDSAELRMFYAAKAQIYHATPIRKDRPETTEWIIRGPYALNKDYYRQVAQLPAEPSAQFEMWGRRETIGEVEAVAEQRVILPAFVPTPRPHSGRRASTGVSAPANGPAISGVTSPSSPSTMTLDQQALIESKEMAQRSPNGDVIHVVKSESETITSISNWYTGSGTNAKKVAEKNSMPLDAKLQPGTRIFVEGEIVVNPKTMK